MTDLKLWVPLTASLLTACQTVEEATFHADHALGNHPTWLTQTAVYRLDDPATAASTSARRRAVAERLGEGTLVLEAGPDEDGRYLADDDFYWLTGLDIPSAKLILEAADGSLSRERLYLPDADPSRDLWEGPLLGPGREATRRTGIEETYTLDEFDEHASLLFAAEASVWGRGETVEALATEAGVVLDEAGGEHARREAHQMELLKPLQEVRDEGEIAALRATVNITQAALVDGMRVAVPGAWEFTAEAAIESGFRKRGAQALAFPSICGSGPNSCVLHYRPNSRQLEEGDLLLMDVGSKYHHYCADITRTIPVSGRFTPRQREIYTHVYEASRLAARELAPGKTLRDAENVAIAYLEEHGYRQYFFHGIGHGLGLLVHDYPFKDDPLRPGMVVTIEPGIYIADEELGVRIEDDYLITADGAELLSGDLPAEPDELEAFLAEIRGRD